MVQCGYITEKFKALRLATIKSLRDRRISSQLLINNLPELGITLPELPEAETAAYVLKHSSFFNHHLTEFVIQRLGTKKDKEILFKYKETFTEYGRCECLSETSQFNDGLRDCLSEVSQSSRLATLVMIFTPGKTLTINDLYLFFNKFQTKINVSLSSIFNLCHIEAMDRCSFKLTIQLPISIVHKIGEFVYSGEQEMITMGIDHLCFMCQFIDRSKYQVIVYTYIV